MQMVQGNPGLCSLHIRSCTLCSERCAATAAAHQNDVAAGIPRVLPVNFQAPPVLGSFYHATQLALGPPDQAPLGRLSVICAQRFWGEGLYDVYQRGHITISETNTIQSKDLNNYREGLPFHNVAEASADLPIQKPNPTCG